MKYDMIKCNTIRYDEIPYNSKKYYMIQQKHNHKIHQDTIPYDKVQYHKIQSNTIDYRKICQGVTSCVHERGRNQISPFWTQVMFSVFRGPKYDDIRPNHTKKYQKITFGVLFSLPPQNALQCTTVQCNVL